MASQLRKKIARAAGGNPLFIEEMVSMADEADARILVPPTLQALLAARLDQLEPRERRVLEFGAVEGEIFHRGAVQALAQNEPQVTPQLAALMRKELMPETPQFEGEDGFRFRHLLIRDAAYDGLPKTTRADLHERFASWLNTRERLVEQDEIVGYHLEQAARYRQELGSPDPRLAEAAAAPLGVAARFALDRGDWTAARALSRRGRELVPEEHPLRLAVLPTYVFAFWDVEGGRLAQEAIDELLSSQDERAQAYGLMLAAEQRIFQGGGGSAEELERASENARVTFEQLADDSALACAYRGIGLSRWVRGRIADMVTAFEHEVAYATRSGAVRFEEEDRSFLVSGQVFGATPVRKAIRYCERQLREVPESDRLTRLSVQDAEKRSA